MSYIKYSFKITLSFIIVFFLFTQFPIKQILLISYHSQVNLIVLALVLGIISIILTTLRWQLLLNHLGYQYTFGLLSKLAFTTLFFNTYIPGGVIGEITRIRILSKHDLQKSQNHKIKIVASVVTDRILGLLSILCLAILGFIFCYTSIWKHHFMIYSLLFLVVITTTICLFLFSQKIHHMIRSMKFSFFEKSPVFKDFIETTLFFKKNHTLFLKAFPLSILANIFVVGYFFLLAKAIQVDIHFLKMLTFVPIIEVISSIPLTIGGVGFREASSVLLFSSEGISSAHAISISLLSFGILLVLGSIGGLFFLFSFLKKEHE